MSKSEQEAWTKLIVGITVLILFGSIRSCMSEPSSYQRGTLSQGDNYSVERRFEEIQREKNRGRQQEY